MFLNHKQFIRFLIHGNRIVRLLPLTELQVSLQAANPRAAEARGDDQTGRVLRVAGPSRCVQARVPHSDVVLYYELAEHADRGRLHRVRRRSLRRLHSNPARTARTRILSGDSSVR
jgi:hypothetical protein